MHGPYRDSDPDQTKPPTRVDQLWGTKPPRSPVRPVPSRSLPAPAPHRSTEDVLALYRAACDCLTAGSHAGATALLRRLILQETRARGREVATREEAERLLETAEVLLGFSRAEDRPSNT